MGFKPCAARKTQSLRSRLSAKSGRMPRGRAASSFAHSSLKRWHQLRRSAARNAPSPQHIHRCLDPEEQSPARLSQSPADDPAAVTHIGKIHGHGAAYEPAGQVGTPWRAQSMRSNTTIVAAGRYSNPVCHNRYLAKSICGYDLNFPTCRSPSAPSILPR